MGWFERSIETLVRAAFAGHELPPDLRARIALLRERAARDGGLTLTCGGVSMEPVIRMGDAVRVRPGHLVRGAVAAFVGRRGAIELHRLVMPAPPLGWWVHAGDNQVTRELGLVHASQIIGLADVPVVTPGPVASARAAARLACATGRVLRASLRGERDDAAWRHAPAGGAPADAAERRQPR